MSSIDETLSSNGDSEASVYASVNGNAGNVVSTDITSEMQVAYLDYAMSVIVARALPDVRDGLKPVHRRILYAMHHDLGLTHIKPHKKSARIVGEVLGKYHPHGDSAVYDAMVRMAQDFSLRYPLIDGQGNFGSIDGDNAAAMRYTEARLAELSEHVLADLEKETVGWHDNFDNSLLEPDILPAALPNLLVNGSSGIAVGMATNVPPHNLGEVVDALGYVIDHYTRIDDITVEQLMGFIKGPDFPTGGILYRFRDEGKAGEETDVIAQGYSVGKARLVIQAKAHFEEMSRSRSRIVITELPYQTNKVALLERIASLVRDGKIEGITDLRDESDRSGMRIVVELTRNVDPKDILADLFKYTPLQQTFGMQMLALAHGEPRTLSLKRMLHLFIQHREEIVRRRSEYDLRRARERAHILEGLLRALDILDEVIATIRHSRTVETARANLIKNFDFTEVQAQAILDMQLRRLAALERKKLQDEFDELRKRIVYLEDLLAHPEKILQVIKEELFALKQKYADGRRTQIVDRTKGTLTTTDLLPDQDVWLSLSADGELQRQDAVRLTSNTVRALGRNSQVALLRANTRDQLYLFTKDGRCTRVSVHEIPQDGSAKHLAELSEFSRRDDVTAAVALPRPAADQAQGGLFLATEGGVVKRVTLSDLMAPTAPSYSVINVEDKDRLIAVFITRGDQEVILVSSTGKSIRFAEEEVRSMGLPAAGVGGMKLGKGERIVYAGAVDPAGELMTVTEKGYAKRTPLDQYSSQGRNGGGIVTHSCAAKTGKLAAALVLSGAVVANAGSVHLVAVSKRGAAHPLTVDGVPQMGRGVQGKQAVFTGAGDAIAALHRVADSEAVPGPGGPGAAAAPPSAGDSPRLRAGSKSTEPAAAHKPATAPSKPATTSQAASQAKASGGVVGTSRAAQPAATAGRPGQKPPGDATRTVKTGQANAPAASPKPAGAKEARTQSRPAAGKATETSPESSAAAKREAELPANAKRERSQPASTAKAQPAQRQPVPKSAPAPEPPPAGQAKPQPTQTKKASKLDVVTTVAPRQKSKKK